MRTCLIAALLIGIPALGLCQSTTLLRGNVTDPQGATIPEAVVKLVDAQTGSVRQTLTNATGEYQFVQLTPGTYSVTAEKTGFATITRSGQDKSASPYAARVACAVLPHEAVAFCGGC